LAAYQYLAVCELLSNQPFLPTSFTHKFLLKAITPDYSDIDREKSGRSNLHALLSCRKIEQRVAGTGLKKEGAATLIPPRFYKSSGLSHRMVKITASFKLIVSMKESYHVS